MTIVDLDDLLNELMLSIPEDTPVVFEEASSTTKWMHPISGVYTDKNYLTGEIKVILRHNRDQYDY